MSDQIATVRYPELIFGIAGPIGADIGAVEATLRDQLSGVGYTSITIKVTSEMLAFSVPVDAPSSRNTYTETMFKIKYADELCRSYKDKAAIARVAVRAISNQRASVSGSATKIPSKPTAYIIRQLKRPEEVLLLRALYGRQFILISAYGSGNARREFLISTLRRNLSTLMSEAEIASKADELIDIDLNERAQYYGQNIRDTFPLGDVFIDGMSKLNMAKMLDRFIQALFGRNDIAPTKTEYGMYAARSASLRSSDLSRQVGAAIFSPQGEIITQGCNEVPRAFGGTYWDQEEPDFRDVRIGHDPNEELKRHILRDLFERLARAKMLSPRALEIGSAAEIVDTVTHKSPANEVDSPDGALVDADIMDLTEYGRVVHAEMCAICDAARLGRSVKNGILFCTAFPCHNCTKHIIAAGICSVVYLEPYPKSKAKELHDNEIEIESVSASKVSFVPFIGISPYRYRDIFQKGRRKTDKGEARRWYYDEPRPMIETVSPYYLDDEGLVWGALIGSLTPSADPPKQST